MVRSASCKDNFQRPEYCLFDCHTARIMLSLATASHCLLCKLLLCHIMPPRLRKSHRNYELDVFRASFQPPHHVLQRAGRVPRRFCVCGAHFIAFAGIGASSATQAHVSEARLGTSCRRDGRSALGRLEPRDSFEPIASSAVG